MLHSTRQTRLAISQGLVHSKFGYRYQLINQGHAQRANVEAYISQCFMDQHRAQIHHFMPVILAVVNQRNEFLSAVGFRDAALESLFLEVYLARPVEQVLAKGDSASIPRERIVEVGNLVSEDHGACHAMFKILNLILIGNQYQWLVATGNRKLLRLLKYLGLETTIIANADQAKLPVCEQTWGNYYDHDPIVIAGKTRPVPALIQQQYRGQ
jgi:hypothetical protein